MKKSYLIIGVGMALILSFGILQAQPTFDLQLVVERNDGVVDGFFDVKIQMKSNVSTFELGTSNLVFKYNDGGLTNPTLLTMHNFGDGNYNTMTATGAESSPASINIELNSINNGETVTSDWMDIATIRFEITAPAQTSMIEWRMSPPNATTVFMDDEATIVDANMLTGLDDSLPVELASFAANVADGAVLLTWTTASETNNLGFDVERSTDEIEFEKVGFIEGNVTTAVPQHYEFRDEVTAPGSYYYRLKQIDLDGAFDYSGVLNVAITGPKEFSLAQNYPNPFNPETNIRYEVPAESHVVLKIYNILGQEVRALVDREQQAGVHSVIWDGRDNLGREVSSGIYLYRLSSGNFSKTLKLSLMR